MVVGEVLRLDKTLGGMVRDWICEEWLVCVRLGKNGMLKWLPLLWMVLSIVDQITDLNNLVTHLRKCREPKVLVKEAVNQVREASNLVREAANLVREAANLVREAVN